LDRFYDTLPAGLFALDAFEQFLESFFSRRGVTHVFSQMPKPLRILAHDLDSGEPVYFCDPGFDAVPVSRACAATLALPPFFSPVTIGARHYIDAGAAQVVMLDRAVETSPDVIVVVNPLVPLRVNTVPTGHGDRKSIVDKGSMWVVNQTNRIGVHTLLRQRLDRIRRETSIEVLCVEPESTDGILFLHNPASFSSRRAMLEYAYRSTRERLLGWLGSHPGVFQRAEWSRRRSVYPEAP
jgi:predicted acylesterase/phospholipase RssA